VAAACGLRAGASRPSDTGSLYSDNAQPATPANGATISFASPTRDAVDKFHEAGLANGGTDEGQPGPRGFTPTAYAAYLHDPDGNKICTFCFAEE
jgi:catechol 2,3-dioxygenase-like lactoylglutathione lyase family enzyme